MIITITNIERSHNGQRFRIAFLYCGNQRTGFTVEDPDFMDGTERGEVVISRNIGGWIDGIRPLTKEDM